MRSTIVVSAMLALGPRARTTGGSSSASPAASRPPRSRSSAGARSRSRPSGANGRARRPRSRPERASCSERSIPADARRARRRSATSSMPLPRRSVASGSCETRTATGSALPTRRCGSSIRRRSLHRCARGSVPRRHVGADEEPCVCLPRPGNERDAARVSRSVTQRHRLRSRDARARILLPHPTRPPHKRRTPESVVPGVRAIERRSVFRRSTGRRLPSARRRRSRRRPCRSAPRASAPRRSPCERR